jgi:hypothetical protein
MTPAPTPPRLPDELEERLRALMSWKNLRDLGLQVLADRGSATVLLLQQAAQLGLAAGRAQGLEEAASIADRCFVAVNEFNDTGDEVPGTRISLKHTSIADAIRALAAKVKP